MNALEAKIPEDQSRQIRALVHDVANALETIVMTHYLLTMTELSDPSKQWLEMMDTGVKKAASLNKELGEYVHQHS